MFEFQNESYKCKLISQFLLLSSQSIPEHHKLVLQQRIQTAQNIIGTQRLSIGDIDVRRGDVSAQRTGHQETTPFRSFCCYNIRRQSSFFPQTVRLSNSSSKLNLNSPDFTVQPRVVEYICCLFLMCRQKQERNLLCFLCYSACKRILHQ